MKWSSVCLALGLLASSYATAAPPCDFKGVAVGSRITADQIMATLGVKTYKLNPPQTPWEKIMPLEEKYGLMSAAEIDAEHIGAACSDTWCQVPFGIWIGNHGVPVKVFIGFHADLVTAIEISFSEVHWDEVRSIIDEKFGADWSEENSPITIVDMETKKASIFDRVTLDHKTKGLNPSSGSHCEIGATNFDIIEQHHDIYGPYHSVVGIHLIPNDF